MPKLSGQQFMTGVMELLAVGKELDEDINAFERAQIQWLHDTGVKHSLSNEALSALAATAPSLEQILKRRIAMDEARGVQESASDAGN